VLSSTSFYSTLTGFAWWPLVLLAAHRGTRAALAAGALCCGLTLLGGEPVFAAAALVPLALAAVQRWGWRRGLAVVAAIGGGGALVALPQLVATLRILPDSFRLRHGVTAEEAVLYRLHPIRLLELLAPIPWRSGPWPRRWIPGVPYFYSLCPGVVATLLALAGARRQRALALLGAAALLLAWSPLVPGQLVASVSFGLFRFPEKALVWLAFALPLLAAAGLDRCRQEPRAVVRALAWVVGAIVSASVGVRWLAATDLARAESLDAGALVLALLLASLAAWALWRRLPLAVVLLELAALLPMRPLLLTDVRAPYAQPVPWQQRLGGRTAVAILDLRDALGPVAQARRRALTLDKTPGVLFGLTYPVASNVCGLDSWRESFLEEHLRAARVPPGWLRTLGVEAVVAAAPLAAE